MEKGINGGGGRHLIDFYKKLDYSTCILFPPYHSFSSLNLMPSFIVILNFYKKIKLLNLTPFKRCQ